MPEEVIEKLEDIDDSLTPPPSENDVETPSSEEGGQEDGAAPATGGAPATESATPPPLSEDEIARLRQIELEHQRLLENERVQEAIRAQQAEEAARARAESEWLQQFAQAAEMGDAKAVGNVIKGYVDQQLGMLAQVVQQQYAQQAMAVEVAQAAEAIKTHPDLAKFRNFADEIAEDIVVRGGDPAQVFGYWETVIERAKAVQDTQDQRRLELVKKKQQMRSEVPSGGVGGMGSTPPEDEDKEISRMLDAMGFPSPRRRR
jgi:hypothetical protein